MKLKCLHPEVAWQCGWKHCKSDGVLSPNMVFNATEAIQYFRGVYGDAYPAFMSKAERSIPCGKCFACQIRKRRDLTTRLTHESQVFHDNCCFITLTYNDEHLPTTDCFKLGDVDKQFSEGSGSLPINTLRVSDVQKFIKRLRRHLEYCPSKKHDGRDHVDGKIRYYCVGEYGGKFGRPHYHILVFGWTPSDMVFWKKHNGHDIFRSSQIEKLWKFGFSTVEPVVGGVARYCSRYVTKKFHKISDTQYLDECRVPEFILQSTRGGAMGSSWFDKNMSISMERGYCLLRSGDHYYKAPLPQYYYNRLRKKNLPLWLKLRDQRIAFVKSHVQEIDDHAYEDLLRLCASYGYRERSNVQRDIF